MRSRGRYISLLPECVVLTAMMNISYTNSKHRSLLKVSLELNSKSL